MRSGRKKKKKKTTHIHLVRSVSLEWLHCCNVQGRGGWSIFWKFRWVDSTGILLRYYAILEPESDQKNATYSFLSFFWLNANNMDVTLFFPWYALYD